MNNTLPNLLALYIPLGVIALVLGTIIGLEFLYGYIR